MTRPGSRSLLNRLRESKQLWQYLGRTLEAGYEPAHPAVKVRLLRSYARRFSCSVFVETGTYMGETVAALSSHFEELFSIEIDASLHRQAQERLRHLPNVDLRLGDCSAVLPAVVAEIAGRALFWLDGHYSGPGTGRGPIDDPILESLQIIRESGRRGDVIVIDDVRDFLRLRREPNIAQILALLQEIDPRTTVRIKHDMLIAHPE